MKTCVVCKNPKSLDDFGKDKNSKDGFTSACLFCRRERYKAWYDKNLDKIKKKIEATKDYRKSYYSEPDRKEKFRLRRISKEFSISPEDYNKLKENQLNLCAICNKPEGGARTKELAVDHDHVTGKVRGLLCSNCNRALGLLGDSKECLKKAIEYLNGNIINIQ